MKKQKMDKNHFEIKEYKFCPNCGADCFSIAFGCWSCGGIISKYNILTIKRSTKMTILSQKKREANKNHKCSLCNGNIEKGQKYINQAIVFEGEPYRNKYHIHCYNLMEKLGMDHDEGISEDDFYEYLHDYINEKVKTAQLAVFVNNHLKEK